MSEVQNLKGLKRRELQALCKENNIKANGKNVELIELLSKYFADQSLEEKVLKKTNSQITLATVAEEEIVLEEDVSVSTEKITDTEHVLIQEANGEDKAQKESESQATRKNAEPVQSTITECESKTSKLPVPTREDDSDTVFKVKRDNDPDTFEPSKKQKLNPIQTHSRKEKPGFHIKKYKPPVVVVDPAVPQPLILLPRDDPVTEFTFEGPQESKLKFDLQESLKKPLPYKPKTGKLPPFPSI